MTRERWMIVRRSQSIPGGYRVVRAGLSEEQARSWAPHYKRPHEAMSEKELTERRMEALADGPASRRPYA